MRRITFNNRQSPFFNALRAKIDNYFVEKNIKPTGDIRLYSKTVILIIAAIVIYSLLVFAHLPIAIAIALCVLLGMSFASIGFNIMHDGAHGSYSNSKSMNNIAALSLNLMGGSSFMWKVKHNLVHHSFTNIEGMDDDIDIKPLMRVNEQQPKLWIHKYQHIYGLLLYGATYLVWIFVEDFRKYFTHKVGETPIRKMTLSQHIGFWATKIFYIALFLIVPAFLQGIVATIVGYAITVFATGVTIAVVFQLAHIVEGTKFPEADPNTHKIEQEWAVHQIETTANFATKSRLVSWFMGGLNFQVEHHLFPKISHVHYPALSSIVRETCAEFNVQYIEYPTVWSAIGAHLRHLKALGR
jgi:linoleoyl-CoA desaturase